jgi:hypothetical protein
MPYLRAPAWDANTGLNPNWLESNFSSLRFAKEGIYGANEPIVQEMLDVVEAHQSKLNAYDGANPIPTALGPTLATLATEEDWFNTGSNGGRAPGQGGYESHAGLYLVSDVPLFLRAMYNTYAVEIMPAKGYIFSECPFGKYASDKTFEEAAFLERVRMMLVMEEGDSLWVARATPRAWLKQGQKIGVRNSPTFFGTLAYEIVSDVDHGRTTATVQMPSRNAPKSVLLRLRHPKALPIKSVEVNGKPWTDFDKDKEYIRLHGLTGAVAVRASY